MLPAFSGIIACQNDSPSARFLETFKETGEIRCSGSGTGCYPAFSLQVPGQRERPRQPEPQIRQRQKSTREKQGRSGVLTCVPSFSFTARGFVRLNMPQTLACFQHIWRFLAPVFLFMCLLSFVLKTSLSTRPRYIP